jgi:hypothetical protein
MIGVGTRENETHPSDQEAPMTNEEPLSDDDMTTTPVGGDNLGGDADGTDGGDADGTDGDTTDGDATDTTDGDAGDADGTDGDAKDTTDGDAS